MARSFVSFIMLVLISSCLPTKKEQGIGGADASKMTSIAMPIPEKLKPYISSDKINGFNLAVTPGSCDTNVVGTRINKLGQKLDLSGAKLANEMIKQNCAYTLVISLGKLSVNGSKLEKIYLTNDADGKRTQVTKEQTKTATIKVTATLFVTPDGQKDLGISDSSVPLPSTGESDVDINIDINGSGSGGQQGQNLLDFNWREKLELVSGRQYGFGSPTFGSGFYQDIMSYSARKFTSGSPMTNAHETRHHINADFRNAYYQQGKFGTLYIGGGQAGLVPEPKTPITAYQDHIPSMFKSRSKYQMYIIQNGPQYYMDRLLYIFDEWSGYVADIRVASEMLDAGTQSGFRSETCIGDGAIEFLIFNTAGVLALAEREPEYLKNEQFRSMYAFYAEETMKYFNKHGSVPQISCTANTDYQFFKTSNEMARARQLISNWLGGGWTQRVFGF